MDVRDLLSVDHREVVDLARLVQRSGSADCRLAAHRRLTQALRAHTLAEESVVHAALSCAQADQRAALGEARVEHTHAEWLIARLQPDGVRADGWWFAWQGLIDELLAHIDEEERELFGALERHFSAEERAAMASRYLAVQRGAVLEPLPAT